MSGLKLLLRSGRAQKRIPTPGLTKEPTNATSFSMTEQPPGKMLREMPFRFLALPRELRNIIYNYYMRDAGILKLCSTMNFTNINRHRIPNFKGFKSHSHSLLHSCREIRSEYAHELRLANRVFHEVHFRPPLNASFRPMHALEFTNKHRVLPSLFREVGELSEAKHLYLTFDFGRLFCRARAGACDCFIHTEEASRSVDPFVADVLQGYPSRSKVIATSNENRLQQSTFEHAVKFVKEHCRGLVVLHMNILHSSEHWKRWSGNILVKLGCTLGVLIPELRCAVISIPEEGEYLRLVRKGAKFVRATQDGS